MKTEMAQRLSDGHTVTVSLGVSFLRDNDPGRIESSWRKQSRRSIKPKKAEKTGFKWLRLQCDRTGSSHENSRGL
jgi:hypothetical protein